MGNIEQLKVEIEISKRLELEHKRKNEREKLRHKNIMKEILTLEGAGIKVFVRGYFDIGKKVKE